MQRPILSEGLSKTPADFEAYDALLRHGAGPETVLEKVNEHARKGEWEQAYGLFRALERREKVRLDFEFNRLNGALRESYEGEVEAAKEFAARGQPERAISFLRLIEKKTGLFFTRAYKEILQLNEQHRTKEHDE